MSRIATLTPQDAAQYLRDRGKDGVTVGELLKSSDGQ